MRYFPWTVGATANFYIFYNCSYKLNIPPFNLQACMGICSMYPRGMVPVSEKELSCLFNVRRSSSNISTGTWVRLKKGKYKGDLAQVFFSGSIYIFKFPSRYLFLTYLSI